MISGSGLLFSGARSVFAGVYCICKAGNFAGGGRPRSGWLAHTVLTLPKIRVDSTVPDVREAPRLGVGVGARVGTWLPSLLLDAASGGELVDLPVMLDVGLRVPIASGLTVELNVVEGDTVSDGWSIIEDSPPFALIVLL